VIGKEFKAMLTDLISEVACDCDSNAAKCKTDESEHPSKSAPKQQSKIKKVDID